MFSTNEGIYAKLNVSSYFCVYHVHEYCSGMFKGAICGRFIQFDLWITHKLVLLYSFFGLLGRKRTNLVFSFLKFNFHTFSLNAFFCLYVFKILPKSAFTLEFVFTSRLRVHLHLINNSRLLRNDFSLVVLNSSFCSTNGIACYPFRTERLSTSLCFVKNGTFHSFQHNFDFFFTVG